MNSFSRLLPAFVFLAILIGSCSKCEEKTVTCEKVPDKYVEPIDRLVGDSIVFKNELGERIAFYVNWREISPEKTFTCFKDGLGGCACPDCGEWSKATYSAYVDDSSYFLIDTFYNAPIYFNTLTYEIRNYLDIRVSYRVLDAVGFYALEPFSTDDKELLTNYVLGGYKYDRIIKHIIDPNNLQGPYVNVDGVIVSEIYISPDHGIVGFRLNETNSLYYLEEI